MALPEKRGAWEVVFHFAPYQKCNACGFEMPMTAGEGVSEIKLHRYCPDCGARMDGGDRAGYEKDEHQPGLFNLVVLADTLGVGLDEYIGRQAKGRDGNEKTSAEDTALAD